MVCLYGVDFALGVLYNALEAVASYEFYLLFFRIQFLHLCRDIAVLRSLTIYFARVVFYLDVIRYV